ncbi:MAG: signal peptidase II [Nanoarchaeota archaeon]
MISSSSVLNRFFLIPSLIVLLFDLATKTIFRYADLSTQGLIAIRPTTNTGTLFSLFSTTEGINLIFIILSFLALALLYYFLVTEQPFSSSTMVKVASGIIAGGIVGNLIDRLFFGAVFDWISVWKWPIFNIADTGIVIGVCLLMLLLIKEIKQDGTVIS